MRKFFLSEEASIASREFLTHGLLFAMSDDLMLKSFIIKIISFVEGQLFAVSLLKITTFRAYLRGLALFYRNYEYRSSERS